MDEFRKKKHEWYLKINGKTLLGNYFKYFRGPLSNTAEEFFLDVVLQKHARRLLSARRLTDLGHFAAHLDFHLVAWLVKERERVARIDDFVNALKQVHEDFNWPYPTSSVISSKLTNSGKSF